jgi:hypothetical protein
MSSSPARFEANRQNAQSSTGPRTPEGRQKSALNAVRHGFTGQTMLLTAEETEAYQNFTDGILKDLAPLGVHETAIAHTIINNRWRVNQIAAMESAIYALGQRLHAEQFAGETPEMAASLSRLLTFEQKRPELDRLRRYESSLNRQINKEMALLAELQTARKTQAAQQEKDAIALLTHFTTTGVEWDPADFGFDLSIDQIQKLEERQFLRKRICEAKSA